MPLLIIDIKLIRKAGMKKKSKNIDSFIYSNNDVIYLVKTVARRKSESDPVNVIDVKVTHIMLYGLVNSYG